MSIALVVTQGFGNGTFSGSTANIVVRGYLPAASTTYTLDCDVGTYTLTGTAAGLTVSRVIVCDVGSYTLAGIDATLTYTSAGQWVVQGNVSGTWTVQSNAGGSWTVQ